ncbi:hypothetical protein DL98DRAFT_517972 [Cadophora sp. DSE1049]|nr:hypothetical protein DL98DRAFT_517972 [Cadophora sp. DSE1049]
MSSTEFNEYTMNESEGREALPFFLLSFTFVTVLLHASLIDLATNPDLAYISDLSFFAATGSVICPFLLISIYGSFVACYVYLRMNEERTYRLALALTSLVVTATILMVFWFEHVYVSVFILVTAWSLLALSLGVGAWEYFWNSSIEPGWEGRVLGDEEAGC